MDSTQVARLQTLLSPQVRSLMGLLIAFTLGFSLWFLPPPEGLSLEAWHMFALFSASILAIVLKPLPMGATALLSLTFLTVTKTATFNDAFAGFSNDISWLIVIAFFIARGFITTGLGTRISYRVLKLLGASSLGLGYGVVATDFILSPLIPSSTARTGGIVFPIVKSLASLFNTTTSDPKMGTYLTLIAFQGSVITSALFLTSMAGNPLIAQLAKDQGIEITWTSWITASCVPGLLSLLIVPYLIYRLSPPLTQKTPHARELARTKLAELGPMKLSEWIMTGVFFLLIALWIFGASFGIKATTAALIGLSILLLTQIVKWQELLNESAAWDTFIWFSTFITLATCLQKSGFTAWFNQIIVGSIHGLDWTFAFAIVSLVYFYSHYFFVSQAAHIGAMYAPILILCLAAGTPPLLAGLLLAFFSNLYAGLTHYGSGPAAVLFGAGYMSVSHWWKIGALVALANIAIWAIAGSLWWKLLGLY